MLATVSAAFRSAGVIYVASTVGSNRRINAYEINVGQVASAYANTDTSILWDVSRIGASAGLAASAITPNPLDGTATTAALSNYFNTPTTDSTPTVTTQGNGLSLYTWPINQRGFNRWRALDDGDNIIVPNVAFNGLAIRLLCALGAQAFSGIGTLAFGEA